MKIKISKMIAILGLISSVPCFAQNPCAGNEGHFWTDSVLFFQTKGYAIQRLDVGNGITPSNGNSIYMVRGYFVSPTGNVSALMRVGECNPATGLYEHLAFSASGASLSNCIQH
jgi:hypothetical protein